MLGAQAAPVLAQQRGTVTGEVVESGTRRPLAGAQVFIPGTGIGGLTNPSGRYVLLNVPAGEVRVRVQMIGYGTAEQSVTVTAGQSATASFEVGQSAIALDEVVVTGAGIATEKRKLGNTVATINTEAITEMAPVVNVSEILQGREPGVVGMPGGGLAGEGAKIRIRGSSSLSQSNEPIFYVDGVRVDNAGGFGPGVGTDGGSPSRLDDINPEAIERIEILKGAAAATLYGTEASNGVIQVFTKRGRTGEPRWSFRVDQGVSAFPADRYKPHAGFARTQEQADRLSEVFERTIRPFEPFEVGLVPQLFETGHNSVYSVTVNGGSSAITYFLAGRIANEDGPFGGTIQHGSRKGERWGPANDVDEKRQLTANVAIFPRENLRLRVSSMYTESHHETPENNNNIYGTISGMINSKPENATMQNPTGALAFSSVRENFQQQTFQNVERFSTSLSANYTPIESINIDGTFGVDLVNQRAASIVPFGWNLDGVVRANVLGSRTVSDRNHREASFTLNASWNRNIGENLSSTFLLGGQTFVSRTNSAWGTGNEFPGPGIEITGGGAIQTTDESFLAQVNAGAFAQEQIGFRDYAFLTVGGRYDRHSAFGESAGGAFYPKVSLSVVPSDVPGWSQGMVSTLRFRGALGRSGLQPGAFDKFTTFSAQASDLGPGVAPSNLGNPDLKPEVSTEWEAGTEVGLFADRAALNVTYWNRTVDDLLVSRQFPVTGGFRDTQLDNIGQLKAWGVEIGAKGFVVNTSDFSLNLFANASFLREKIAEMGAAPPIKVGYFRYLIWLKEGYAPGAFFGPKLLDADYPLDTNRDGQPDTREQLLAYLDQPRTLDALDQAVLGQPAENGDLKGHYLGKPTPDWQGSFGLDMTFFGNFQLTSLFEYKVGNFFVHNLTDAFRRSHPVIGRTTLEAAQAEATLMNEASTPEERLEAARVWATELKALSPLDGLNEVEKADFLRWRELSLTYNVPTSLAATFRASSLAFTVSGRNLALLSPYSGIDPEINVVGRGAGDNLTNNFLNGVDAWGLALPRRFTFSARVGF